MTRKTYSVLYKVRTDVNIFEAKWSISLVLEIAFGVILFLVIQAAFVPFIRKVISIWTSPNVKFDRDYYKLTELQAESISNNNSVMYNEYLRSGKIKERATQILNLHFTNGALLMVNAFIHQEPNPFLMIIAIVLLLYSLLTNDDSYDQTLIRKRNDSRK